MGKKKDKIIADEKKLQRKKKGCGMTSSSSSSSSCCEREGVRRGVWSEEEDKILVDYITNNGHGTWRNLPKLAGLLRCGKSCRLRWTNYLRPDIKRGPFTLEEENTIVCLHDKIGNKWAAIASQLPGRTDNDIKNFWNSYLRKRFDNRNDKKVVEHSSSCPAKSTEMMLNGYSSSSTHHHLVQWENVRLEPELHHHINQPWTQPENDYFMRLWNSEVGQSFRNLNNNGASQWDGVLNHSPQSQTSSALTKVNSVFKSPNISEARKIIARSSPSEMDDHQKGKTWTCKKEVEDVIEWAYSDSSKSYEMEDSPDAMLKLLLDFPVGGNDMGFLQGPSGQVSNYPRKNVD